MRKVTKFFQTKATSIDNAAKTAQFVISTDQVDRMGEIVDQKSWNFKEYLENPMFLWGHDPSEPKNVLGQCLGLETSEDGSKTIGTFHFDTDINDRADLIFNQVERGSLRTVSVGFMVGNEEVKSGVPILKNNNLFEVSIAPIPANPGAVALDLKAGKISRKDAKWLMDSMRKEADFVEKQMKLQAEDSNKETDSAMNEVTQKQLSAILSAITKLAEVQEKRNKQIDELTSKGAVADIVNADDSWEIEDAKWANLCMIGNIYYAFCEAYFYTATPVDQFSELLKEFIELVSSVADGSYSEEKAVGDLAKKAIAVDDAKLRSMTEKLFGIKEAPVEEKSADDLAKDGDIDQSGADDGEFDPNAELTPEVQEKIDAALEASAA